MKAEFPRPEHYSYKTHREQRIIQIYLPVILAALLLVGLIVLISVSTFEQGGDVGRWAAISTMWIVIPIILAGLIVLAILGGLIYLMARVLIVLPHYTGLIQDYVQTARGYIIRGADMVVKPIFVFDGWLETIKAFIGRINP